MAMYWTEERVESWSEQDTKDLIEANWIDKRPDEILLGMEIQDVEFLEPAPGEDNPMDDDFTVPIDVTIKFTIYMGRPADS
jgi:hypothetical protein